MELTVRTRGVFCFIALLIVVSEMSMSSEARRHYKKRQRHHSRHHANVADNAAADASAADAPAADAPAADASEDASDAARKAKAAAKAAQLAAKLANKAVSEAKDAKAEAREEKEESEINSKLSEVLGSSAVPTISEDFLNVNLTDSDALIGNQTDLNKTSNMTESNEYNDWSTHCYTGWEKYPCKLGFRHGCQKGICWSQCNAAWRWTLLSSEWCYVSEPRQSNTTGSADGSDWQYLDCQTDADCTRQFAYRRKCQSICSLGW